MCKIITRISRKISTYLEEHNLLPAELKGCHPGSKGCKCQLMTSKQYLRAAREGARIYV